MKRFESYIEKDVMQYYDYQYICNIGIHNISLNETIDLIDQFITKRQQAIVVTPNVDHIIKLQEDEEFKRIYKNASLVLADGMPLLWAAKFLGTPLKAKISGSDLFTRLCEHSADKGYSIFFLGGRPDSAVKAKERLEKKYPQIKIVGVYSPPYGFEKDGKENSKIVNLIRETNPDILFVGLGAPKQEKWIYQYHKELNVPLSIGIGASFEFVSGMIKRAPVWMQQVGLEWFWRLMMEPKRLWKRYLIHDTKFFWLVLKQKLGK